MAEERSGHCAVVDGSFLYVWGGYVVRREEAPEGAGGEDEPERGARKGRGRAAGRGGRGAKGAGRRSLAAGGVRRGRAGPGLAWPSPA